MYRFGAQNILMFCHYYAHKLQCTQGVPEYLPVAYCGNTRWVPENIQVSVEYPGTQQATRSGTRVACYPVMAALHVTKI